jgi:hypothetical protein
MSLFTDQFSSGPDCSTSQRDIAVVIFLYHKCSSIPDFAHHSADGPERRFGFRFFAFNTGQKIELQRSAC